MSIVEKAVSRLDSGPEKKRRPGEGLARRAEGRNNNAGEGALRTTSIIDLELAALGNDPVLVKQFRFLKRPLLARLFGLTKSSSSSGKVIMLTSDLPKVGKSFLALNIAASIAQEQMTNVLLIDADPIRQTLTHQLGQKDQPGILNLVADPELSLEDVVVASDLPSLAFIPSGTFCNNATELFASQRMSEVLASMDDPDRVILLDAPPLLATSEAHALAEKVDHTMIVIEAGRSQSVEISNMIEILKRTDCEIGFILNKAPKFDSSRYKDYYSY